jgi:hypothetical protein
MAKMESTYVKCPFYQWEEGIKLSCAYDESEDWFHRGFASKQKRLEYERRFCKRNWERCPLAKALYEEGYNG